MKIWPFATREPEPRRASTKLDPVYEARRLREIRAALAKFGVTP